jgi:L-alanine-DL-glutamate epimerase-like enolase superfamily enzyme
MEESDMLITEVRAEKLAGPVEESFAYEERLAQPVDVYEEFRVLDQDERKPAELMPYKNEDGLWIEHAFLFVETDAGIQGVAGPLDRPQAALATRFEDLLVGRDPLATEKLWDLMYRDAVHGRKGATMQAISAIDNALWDIKGKHHGEPVYRLLGGPTQEKIPAYASMLGFSVEPERVKQRASEFKSRGYDAQKWFFRYGPRAGEEGKRKNENLVRAAREAVGEGYDLMFDCWMSWDRTYALEMFDRIAEYDPRWIEEPVQPDKLDQLAELAGAAPFPVAGGEHEYTRWGIHTLLQRDAVEVVQTDTYWAGGISELQKIFALGSVHDVPVIPHCHSVTTNVHLSASHSPSVAPMVEYLIKWSAIMEFFLEDPVIPQDGLVEPSNRPGTGVVIDESAVESRTEYHIDW